MKQLLKKFKGRNILCVRRTDGHLILFAKLTKSAAVSDGIWLSDMSGLGFEIFFGFRSGRVLKFVSGLGWVWVRLIPNGKIFLLSTVRNTFFFSNLVLHNQKSDNWAWVVVSRVPSLARPPARPKQILPYPSPPEARTSKKYVGSIKLDTQIRTW